MPLRSVSLDDLIIDDEDSFAHVALYGRLKQRLRQSNHRFQIPTGGSTASWDRALFLNLTYWNKESGADVLCDDHIPADVVAHVAWHHLAAAQMALLSGPGADSAEAMLFGESIASAFDLYLVGRLAGNAPDSDFIMTQIPIMGEAAEQAGLSASGFRG